MFRSTLTFCLIFVVLPCVGQQQQTKDEPDFPKMEEIHW